jgi:putative transposase
VLLRLPYLALTSVFAFMRLLPMSDTNKDIEILALRHQLVALQRQIDKPRPTGRSSPLCSTDSPGSSCDSST